MTTTQTILIVDDNALLLEMLEEVFIYEGFHVLKANNGRAAFELIQSHSNIDVVLSDVQMMGGDGIELMKKLYAFDHPQKPGLILSTGNAQSLGFSPTEYNVLAIHEKPIDYQDLIVIIREYGKKRRGLPQAEAGQAPATF